MPPIRVSGKKWAILLQGPGNAFPIPYLWIGGMRPAACLSLSIDHEEVQPASSEVNAHRVDISVKRNKRFHKYDNYLLTIYEQEGNIPEKASGIGAKL